MHSVLKWIFLFQFVCLLRITYAEDNPCGRQIPCLNGRCIKRGRLCDGIEQCKDGSDEKYCETSGWWNRCDHNYFKCEDDMCIPPSLECDGYVDCRDGSDEKYCEEDANSFGISEVSEKENSSEEKHWEVTTKPLLPQTPSEISSNHPYDAAEHHRRLTSTQSTAIDHYSIRMEGISTTPNYRQITNHYNNRYTQYEARAFTKSPHYISPHASSATHPDTNSYSRPQVYPKQTREHQRLYYPFLKFQTTEAEKNNQFNKLPEFHFRDYPVHYYTDSVQKVELWLYDKYKAYKASSWGSDTARAIVTSFFVQENFENTNDHSLIAKGLKVHLGTSLLRQRNTNLASSKLASYINALIVTCHNPRNFFGINLIEMLSNTMKKSNIHDLSIFPFISLCLGNASLLDEDIQFLKNVMLARDAEDRISRDRKFLATTALSCFQRQDKYSWLKNDVQKAFDEISDLQNSDGSIGSIYSTALAAQALLSVETSRRWDFSKTADFLISHQADDGSFGDMLATYLIAPILKGKSLLHIRNIKCNDTEIEESPVSPTEPVPQKIITYTLRFGDFGEIEVTETIPVPVTSTLFDVMKIAERRSSDFRFTYHENDGEFFISSIRDLPNDPERGYYWNLHLDYNPYSYSLPPISLPGNIKVLLVENHSTFYFWYRYTELVPRNPLDI